MQRADAVSPSWSRVLPGGLAVGAILCATVVYVALATGLSDSGNLTACILGFALGRALFVRRGGYTLHENQLFHAVAAAMAAAPNTIGLIAVLPGLTLLGIEWSSLAAMAWGLGLGLLGIVVAVAWRRGFLDGDELPFPTSVAASTLLGAMHQESRTGGAQARALLGAALVSALATGGRDLLWPRLAEASSEGLRSLMHRLAPVTWAPGSLFGRSAESLSVGIYWSPMLLGIGGLIGVPVGLSVLGGSLLARVGLAPAFLASDADPAGFLAVPGLALLLSASLLGLVGALRIGRGDAASAAEARAGGALGGRRASVAIAAGLAALVPIGAWLFGGPLWTIALGLALAPLGAMLCARAAGATDVSPSGPLGQATQAGLARAGGPGASIGAASAVGGLANQLVSSLWVLRTGRRLGTPLRPQLIALVVGTVVGTAVAVPTYRVLVAARGLGEGFAAPSARLTEATARLAGGGVPTDAALLALGALVVGAVVTATPLRRSISIAGLGIGFLLPVYQAAGLALGAIGFALARRALPDSTRTHDATASGLIIGESLVGVAIAIALALMAS